MWHGARNLLCYPDSAGVGVRDDGHTSGFARELIHEIERGSAEQSRGVDDPDGGKTVGERLGCLEVLDEEQRCLLDPLESKPGLIGPEQGRAIEAIDRDGRAASDRA